jgi:hypothetical protein
MAHIGLGLTKEIAAPEEKTESNVVRVNSMQWLLAQTKKQERDSAQKKVFAKW